MQARAMVHLVLAGLLLFGTTAFAQDDEPGSDAPAPAGQDGKIVLGWVENVRLLPGRMLMKAKLDPGALSSALHAENIELFEKDGRTMVRFTVLRDHDDPESQRVVMERPLVREVNIKLRNNETPDQRPAVRLEFCLAGELHNAVFTLTNRSNFNYPMLLGRRFLGGHILVDSSQSFMRKTRCPRS